MIAFAGNSVLCRIALKDMHADAISFSSLRLISGAIALYLFITIASESKKIEFRWLNALLLCIYVFSFSVAYVSLNTGTGALLLFGTVQLVMTVWGFIGKDGTEHVVLADDQTATRDAGTLQFYSCPAVSSSLPTVCLAQK